MAGIKDYSPIPASNTALFPEGMAPSAVNDGMRQVQADIRAEVATKGTDIASAATVDLDDADGDFVDITGTTTITSLGTVSEGIRRTLRFKGALTLTHNATSLILPGGANITAADGDIARFRSLGEGNWICEFYSRASGAPITDANLAKLDEANIFTANPKIEGGSSTARLTLYRKAATTAAALAELLFNAQNADGDEITGALLRMLLTDATAGSEDGQLVVRLPIGGNETPVATFGAGLRIGAPDGGDPGVGNLNIGGEYQQNGTALPFQKAYESGQQGITSGGTLTLAHSLGVQPKQYMCFLRCVTAEHGFSVGDEVNVLNLQGTDQGCTISPDATNLNIQYGQAAAPFNVINTSGQAVSATSSRWRIIFRAWA